jgi:hypothetical protein
MKIGRHRQQSDERVVELPEENKECERDEYRHDSEQNREPRCGLKARNLESSAGEGDIPGHVCKPAESLIYGDKAEVLSLPVRHEYSLGAKNAQRKYYIA